MKVFLKLSPHIMPGGIPFNFAIDQRFRGALFVQYFFCKTSKLTWGCRLMSIEGRGAAAKSVKGRHQQDLSVKKYFFFPSRVRESWKRRAFFPNMYSCALSVKTVIMNVLSYWSGKLLGMTRIHGRRGGEGRKFSEKYKGKQTLFSTAREQNVSHCDKNAKRGQTW